MRFDSFRSFITFLKALGDLGYQVPFNDYETDFKIKGFNLHIHFYKFTIDIEKEYLILFTTDNYGHYYGIKCYRTKDKIKEQLLIFLKLYIKLAEGIKEVNTANSLLEMIKEGIENEKACIRTDNE